LSLFVSGTVIETEWRQNRDKIETKNINDSDEGSSEKHHLYASVFVQFCMTTCTKSWWSFWVCRAVAFSK